MSLQMYHKGRVLVSEVHVADNFLDGLEGGCFLKSLQNMSYGLSLVLLFILFYEISN